MAFRKNKKLSKDASSLFELCFCLNPLWDPAGLVHEAGGYAIEKLASSIAQTQFAAPQSHGERSDTASAALIPANKTMVNVTDAGEQAKAKSAGARATSAGERHEHSGEGVPPY